MTVNNDDAAILAEAAMGSGGRTDAAKRAAAGILATASEKEQIFLDLTKVAEAALNKAQDALEGATPDANAKEALETSKLLAEALKNFGTKFSELEHNKLKNVMKRQLAALPGHVQKAFLDLGDIIVKGTVAIARATGQGMQIAATAAVRAMGSVLVGAGTLISNAYKGSAVERRVGKIIEGLNNFGRWMKDNAEDISYDLGTGRRSVAAGIRSGARSLGAGIINPVGAVLSWAGGKIKQSAQAARKRAEEIGEEAKTKAAQREQGRPSANRPQKGTGRSHS